MQCNLAEEGGGAEHTRSQWGGEKEQDRSKKNDEALRKEERRRETMATRNKGTQLLNFCLTSLTAQLK